MLHSYKEGRDGAEDVSLKNDLVDSSAHNSTRNYQQAVGNDTNVGRSAGKEAAFFAMPAAMPEKLTGHFSSDSSPCELTCSNQQDLCSTKSTTAVASRGACLTLQQPQVACQL